MVTMDVGDGIGIPVNLPSECRPGDHTSVHGDPIDHESVVQDILAALATKADLSEGWDATERGEIVDWLSKTLTTPCEEFNVQASCQSPEETDWLTGVRSLSTSVPNLSAFELHAVASQSMMLSEGSQSYMITCLLLCTQALSTCPVPLEKRWRRWQSLVCETIRLFQVKLAKTHTVRLWVHHIVPACQHVVRQLPAEAYHVALRSGLIGTASTLTVGFCDHLRDVSSTDLQSTPLLDLLESVRTIVAPNDAEFWLWLHPWRRQPFVQDRPDEVEFLINVSNVAWWSTATEGHARVADMDTSWNELGISLLASLAFYGRPWVLTHTQTWRVWFPHVGVLLRSTVTYPQLENLPLTFLQSLLEAIPNKALVSGNSTGRSAESPYETFQLLSNRIMSKAQEASKQSSSYIEPRAKSEMLVGLMHMLLGRYQTTSQVTIVENLCRECPHPGLRAKFLDLLRPLLFESECEQVFWSFVCKFIVELQAHVDETENNLLDPDTLIQHVEIYISAVTMILLWYKVRQTLPAGVNGCKLGSILSALTNTIKIWGDNEEGPPDGHFRLFLLEGALQQVIELDA